MHLTNFNLEMSVVRAKLEVIISCKIDNKLLNISNPLKPQTTIDNKIDISIEIRKTQLDKSFEIDSEVYNILRPPPKSTNILMPVKP